MNRVNPRMSLWHQTRIGSGCGVTTNHLHNNGHFCASRPWGAGRDVGIIGCGTQPCRLAAEHFQNKIVHYFVLGTSCIHRWLRWFLGRVVGWRQAQIPWPNYLRIFETSWLGRTATQIPNRLDEFSQTQIYFDKQAYCPAVTFEIFWCRRLSCNFVWFGDFALDEIWTPIGGQTAAENASLDRWVGKIWRWRLVCYNVPDEPENGFCNVRSRMQTMVVPDIQKTVS